MTARSNTVLAQPQSDCPESVVPDTAHDYVNLVTAAKRAFEEVPEAFAKSDQWTTSVASKVVHGSNTLELEGDALVF